MLQWVWRHFRASAGLVAWATVGPALGAVLFFGSLTLLAEDLRDGGVLAALVILVGGALACGLALLPTYAVSLLAGWSLGWWLGPVVAMGAMALAAGLSYELVHRWVGRGVQRQLAARPRAAAIYEELAHASPRRTAWLIFLVRLSPVMPFTATNVMLGALGVPRIQFWSGTLLGLAPRAVVVAVLGGGLSELDFRQPTAPWLAVLGVAATLLAAGMVTWVTRQALTRALRAAKAKDPDGA